MRLVFAGTPEVAVPSLDALLASRHDVVAVLTRPDAPAGRGRTVVASPVARRAEAAEIPVLKPTRLRDEAFLDTLRALAPDAAPVVAYGALVPPAALTIPRHGWVNLHFSLLPAWRGAAPVPHALLAGDEVTGATTFRLDEGLDTGPTYGCLTEAVGAHDTAGDLLDRLAEAGAALLVATLDALEDGTIEARDQPVEGVSFAPKVTVEQARVDWSAPAFAVDRLVRAMTPHPGAWTTWRGQRLGLGPLEPADDAGLAPGDVRVTRREVLVGTGTAAVRLHEVRPAGRRPMPAVDWARGARPQPGERLGNPTEDEVDAR
ncbi:MAG TPA: methionyl-tRNA formyltransferase [Actinomycetes bacterium]|nr:methionyl-tRNA formyltransferase [Actinomycetes bacterium]